MPMPLAGPEPKSQKLPPVCTPYGLVYQDVRSCTVCVRSGHVHQTWIFYTNPLHTSCLSWYDVSILQTLCVLSFCTVCVAVLHDNSDYTVVYALISMLWCLMLPHLIPSYLILFHLISSHLILLHLHMLMRFKHL